MRFVIAIPPAIPIAGAVATHRAMLRRGNNPCCGVALTPHPGVKRVVLTSDNPGWVDAGPFIGEVAQHTTSCDALA